MGFAPVEDWFVQIANHEDTSGEPDNEFESETAVYCTGLRSKLNS